MISDILIALAVLAFLALLLLAHPVGRCPRCLGRRMVSSGRSGKRACRRCRGHGIAVMPGATLVHHFFWSVFGDRILGKRKAAVAPAQQSARKERAS